MTPDPASPEELARRLERFGALYEAYHRQAFGLAYYLLGDGSDAEDVVQDAFLRAWRADPGRGIHDTSTRAWLLTLVRHRAIDVLRARRRHPALSLPEELDQPNMSDPSSQAIARVDGQLARQALAGLPPEQRQAMELAYFGGLTHTEIAAQLGLPLGTVKGRLRGALDRLRAKLNARPGSSRIA